MDVSQANSSNERGGKSPGAFRTISEVAGDLDVPQHVLRFWESKFAQVKPLKRGGGRRYYRPEDVELLRGIRRLLYTDGYTIKGVQKLLRDHGTRAIRDAGRGAVTTAPVTPVPAGEAAAAPAAAAPGDAPSETTVEATTAPAAAAGAGEAPDKTERLARVVEELSALQDMLQTRKP